MSSQDPRSFESAAELRQVHGRLLERLDERLERDSSQSGQSRALLDLQPEIEEFLARGAATGVFLEEVEDRTACQVLLDYWVSSLARAGQRVAGRRLAKFDGAQLPDLEDKECPYVGLEAFRDARYFFGRERDTEELLGRVRDNGLVVIIGSSGSGKSSLMLGGLLPRLRTEGGWRVAEPFVPGNRLFEHLAESVAGVSGASTEPAELARRLRAETGRLAELLSPAEAKPVALALDQFEEVFTLSTPDEREALAAALAAVLEAGAGHRVVLSVREEFRSRIAGLRAFEPFLESAWYSMRPMGYEELRAAVLRPAALVNLRFQPGIVDDLVKKVLGQPAALPLLQFTLRQLWDKRDRNRITWEVYRGVGSPLEALETAAEEFYTGLAPQTRDEAKRLLLELVWVDDLLEAYRQPVRKERLLAAGKANTENVLRLLVVNDYVRSTSAEVAGEEVCDLKHEALIRNWPRFVTWIDRKRIARRQRLSFTQAAERWLSSGGRVEALLTGWQLEEAKSYEDLTESERAFVEASVTAVQREQIEKERLLEEEAEKARALAMREHRLRRRATWFLALTGVIAVIVAWAAMDLYKRNRALSDRFYLLKEEQAVLEGEFAQLAREQRDLQLEYDQLFARQVESSVAQRSEAAGEIPVTIYLHISDEAQRPRAAEIERRLEARGINVPGIERVGVPVRETDVRFFRPEDEAGALEIVRLLGEYLLGEGVEVRPKFIPGFEADVPERRYEIWFSPTALGVAGEALETYKVDIYFDESNEADRRRAMRVEAALHSSRLVDEVVLAARPVEFLEKVGRPYGPEIRYEPGVEDRVAVELQKELAERDRSLRLELRRVGTSTPGTLSIMLFSEPGARFESKRF